MSPVIVRCTARVAQALKLGRLSDTPQSRDDWYVNTVTIARRRVVLAIHADTLFPIVAVGLSLAQLRDLPGWLAAQVSHALEDEGLPTTQLGSLDTQHALLVRTASKRILGHLNQLAMEVEWAVQEHGGWDEVDLLELNRALRRSLRGRDGGYVVPLELASLREVNATHDALLAQFTSHLQGATVDELRGLAGTILGSAADRPNHRAQTASRAPTSPLVDVFHLEASIDGADPPITRQLEIPSKVTLEQLHHLLQRAFGWLDYHLYRFARGSSIWGGEGVQLYLCDFDLAEAELDEPPGTPLRRTRLDTVFHTLGDEVRYLYDYGDHWELTLTLIGHERGSGTRAAVTGGQGIAPPDDCGGIHNWNEERPPDDNLVVASSSVATRSLQRRRR